MGLSFPLLPRSVRWVGVLGIAIVLIYFSLLTTPPAAPPDGGGVTDFWDKQLHVAGYLALGLALAYATVTNRRPRFHRALFVLVFAVAFGVGIELLQGPLPDRYFSYADMLANAVGALLAASWFLLEPRLEFIPIPS